LALALQHKRLADFRTAALCAEGCPCRKLHIAGEPVRIG
jgi:hypothetical protein